MKSALFLSACLASLVSAFIDTSPLFLYSTEDLPHNLPLNKIETIATSNQFLDAVKKTISQCSSDAYILVLQPGVHESDFKDSRSAPQLRKFTQSDRFIGVMEGVGYVDLNEIELFVKTRCQAHTVTVDASTSAFNSFEENATAQVIKLDFPVLPTHIETRQKGLNQNDNFLSALISMMPSAKYTVVYVSTPVGDPRVLVHDNINAQKHESFISEQTVMERDFEATADDDTDYAAGGLLSNYQFVTPLLVFTILLGLFVLWVAKTALGALSDIKVSYGAFEKEAAAQDVKKHR